MTTEGFESELELRRRLLTHVVRACDETTVCSAASAMHELLANGHDQMIEELLRPIFEWSGYWPEVMAKEILGLDADEELDLEELLLRFEEPTDMSNAEGVDESDWVEEGF